MTIVPKISIAAFLNFLAEDTTAVSQPIRVLGSDANTYILKTQQAYDASSKSYINLNCSFINEFLAYCIGNHISLPQANIAIANIQKEFLNDNPALVFNNRFKEGAHFASEFVEDTEKNLMMDYTLLIQQGKNYLKKPWNKFFGNITNKNDIPLLIAFDFFIANTDRFAHPDNFLLIGQAPNKHYLMAVDHGHAFGSPIWNTTKLEYVINMENLPHDEYIKWLVNRFFFYNQRNTASNIFKLNGFGDIFKALNYYLDLTDLNNHCFIEPVERISSITPALIDNWLDQIPDEWFVDKINQKIFYRKFIMYQIKFLPHIIQYVATTSGFDNYLGGKLVWKVQNTGTQ